MGDVLKVLGLPQGPQVWQGVGLASMGVVEAGFGRDDHSLEIQSQRLHKVAS